MKKLQIIAVLAVGAGVFLTFMAYQKRTEKTLIKASQYGTNFDDNITGNKSDGILYV